MFKVWLEMPAGVMRLFWNAQFQDRPRAAVLTEEGEVVKGAHPYGSDYTLWRHSFDDAWVQVDESKSLFDNDIFDGMSVYVRRPYIVQLEPGLYYKANALRGTRACFWEWHAEFSAKVEARRAAEKINALTLQ